MRLLRGWERTSSCAAAYKKVPGTAVPGTFSADCTVARIRATVIVRYRSLLVGSFSFGLVLGCGFVAAAFELVRAIGLIVVIVQTKVNR